MFIASLANKAKRVAFTSLSTINTLALKTLVLCFSKNTLQLILYLYQYIIDLLLIALFINLLFKLFKKTQISLREIIDKKSIKSFTTCSFIQSYRLEILFVTLKQNFYIVYKRQAIKLTVFAFRKVSTRYTKQVFLYLVRLYKL